MPQLKDAATGEMVTMIDWREPEMRPMNELINGVDITFCYDESSEYYYTFNAHNPPVILFQARYENGCPEGKFIMPDTDLPVILRLGVPYRFLPNLPIKGYIVQHRVPQSGHSWYEVFNYNINAQQYCGPEVNLLITDPAETLKTPTSHFVLKPPVGKVIHYKFRDSRVPH